MVLNSYPAGATTVGSKNNATFYYRLGSASGSAGATYATTGGVYGITNTLVAPVHTNWFPILSLRPLTSFSLVLLVADDASAIAKISLS